MLVGCIRLCRSTRFCSAVAGLPSLGWTRKSVQESLSSFDSFTGRMVWHFLLRLCESMATWTTMTLFPSLGWTRKPVQHCLFSSFQPSIRMMMMMRLFLGRCSTTVPTGTAVTLFPRFRRLLQALERCGGDRFPWRVPLCRKNFPRQRFLSRRWFCFSWNRIHHSSASR